MSRTQVEREASPDEVMEALRQERPRPAVVKANTGDQVVILAPTRFGDIQADVFVDILGERRTLQVTEKQARKIVMSAKRPDSSGPTLKLLPFDAVEFDKPGESE